MDKPAELRETMTMPNPDFSMKVNPIHTKGVSQCCVYPHWHEEMELLYFTEGSALCKCNNKSFVVRSGDLIVVNCNELHSAINLSENVRYYCIILDPHILSSRIIDLCDSKYINPIIDNTILFKNLISNDKEVSQCIETINSEYTQRQMGFELAIKSTLYRLFVLLMREHVDTILTDSQVKQRMKNMERFNKVLSYIEANFAIELTLESISEHAHMSKYHFCRMFKQMTGHTVSHYINSVRIQEADRLLITTDLSIGEIAFKVGFRDTSYFSRIYKQIKNISPTEKRKLHI
ncbi:AraC family transcriptional regulator [Vallitalea okinawensis]|uniref:AraC family transcriptional regulator n=1 Tax=Vallitalea okinawensis TaxID=2078660 RepID=UPI000CFE158C|nr:AraC family transcriptional regulator [Vallitalea okinawensis]